MTRSPVRRLLFAGAAFAAAGLLVSPAAAQQSAAGSSNSDSRNSRNAGSSDQSSTLTLQGPTGQDVLALTRNPPRQARAGQEVSYTVDVKNVSDFPVQGVVVRESFQGGFEVVSASQKQSGKNQKSGDNQQSGNQKSGNQQQGGGNSPDGGSEFSVDLGTIQPGKSKTVQVVGTAPKEGQVKACLSADYEPTLCTTFDVVAPNLQLTREVLLDARAELSDMGMKNAAYLCDGVAVRYTVKNPGSGVAKSVTLTDDLPQGLVTKDGSKNEVSVDMGDIAAGETETKEYQLTLAEARNRGGRFTLSPAKAKSQSDTARSGEDAAPLRILKPTLDVTIDGPQEQYIDRPAEYTVTVENTSNDPALDTKVMLELPSDVANYNVQSQDASGQTVNVGTLKGGESREFKVTMTAADPKTVSATAKATAYCADEVEQTVETEFKGIAAILLEVVDKTDPVPVDETTIYEVFVKNQGSAPDSEVELRATLPGSLEFVEGTGDSKVTHSGGTVKFQKIPTVAPGDILSWEIKVKAKSAEKVRFKVELTSEANQRPVYELEPTTLY